MSQKVNKLLSFGLELALGKTFLTANLNNYSKKIHTIVAGNSKHYYYNLYIFFHFRRSAIECIQRKFATTQIAEGYQKETSQKMS